MRVPIPAEKAKVFDALPRSDKKPLSEIAAVQTFKLIGWATATAGIYLLQRHDESFGLRLIPYLLWILIVWDIGAKCKWEPVIERTNGQLYVILTKRYFARLALISASCWFIAWAVIFWLAPLVNQHVLIAKLG